MTDNGYGLNGSYSSAGHLTLSIKCVPLAKMLTRQPDYTISELGYPVAPIACESLKKLEHRTLPNSPPSPHRLLPLRETLDDCFKRLMMRSRDDLEEDTVYQQKLRKNQWNEQQQRRSNQKCRDKPTTTTTTSTIASTCDLNNF